MATLPKFGYIPVKKDPLFVIRESGRYRIDDRNDITFNRQPTLTVANVNIMLEAGEIKNKK